jgi:ribosomal 30S subunit maturation factor RimM
VSRLIELPSCETLEVLRPGQGTPLLVPMVRDAIREIDVSSRRIEVDADFLDLPREGSEGEHGA